MALALLKLKLLQQVKYVEEETMRNITGFPEAGIRKDKCLHYARER